MKYSRFEELPVWKDAIELAVRVFKLTAKPAMHQYRSVRDQLERASMSISNNIAEGFERGTTKETLTFLYIARGSAGETRSVLYLAERLPGTTDLRSEISDLRSRAESISRQLRAWCQSLQDGDIPGQRYFTKRDRDRQRAIKEREEALKEFERFRNENMARNRPTSSVQTLREPTSDSETDETELSDLKSEI